LGQVPQPQLDFAQSFGVLVQDCDGHCLSKHLVDGAVVLKAKVLIELEFNDLLSG
jgi:hypothetical protein